MEIRRATLKDAPEAARLALLLWPSHSLEELQAELEEVIASSKGAVFLAFSEREALASGFAQCQLRVDYVEGTASSPVGYLEGIYVQPETRLQGTARALLAACEQWAAGQGCREFASDCGLENGESLRFHLSCGFEEAGRIICFVKEI